MAANASTQTESPTDAPTTLVSTDTATEDVFKNIIAASHGGGNFKHDFNNERTVITEQCPGGTRERHGRLITAVDKKIDGERITEIFLTDEQSHIGRILVVRVNLTTGDIILQEQLNWESDTRIDGGGVVSVDVQ
jgi:hypothetical protein